MEYLIQGINISGELCPMSAGGGCTCQGDNSVFTCGCFDGWEICGCKGTLNACTCKSRCFANCPTLTVCGIGQVGQSPMSVG